MLGFDIWPAYKLSKFHDFAQRYSIPNICAESRRKENVIMWILIDDSQTYEGASTYVYQKKYGKSTKKI